MFDELRTRALVFMGGSLGPPLMVFSGLSLMPLLSGCIFSSDRPDLSLDLPDAYLAARGNVYAALPTLDWWRRFRSDELTRFIEEAQTANLDIAAAIGRIMQADAQSKIAGAPLLPALTFAGSGSRIRPAGGPERGDYRAILNASYQIDFWGQNAANSRAAEESAVVARFNKEVVVLSTIVSVGTAYFNILTAQDRLRIARENLAAATRILTLVQQRAEQGTASALDVAQQQSLVDTVRAGIPLLDESLRQNIAVLAALIGRPPESLVVTGGSLYRLAVPQVSPGLPSQLLFQRPDIRAAEASLKSADASVEAARAAFYPNITLTGQGGYESTALRLLFTPQNALYNLALNMTQPIFDGYVLEGKLEFAKGQQFELLKNYCQTVLAGFRDVEVALIAVTDSAERERLQNAVVISSRRAFQLAETRLREGVADLVVVLQTQQTLFTAEDAQALDRQARLQAALSLFQALGGGWLPPGVGAGPIFLQ
jgi:NodT family efflux transporter outer membrane factor (OMF) lipoprotein